MGFSYSETSSIARMLQHPGAELSNPYNVLGLALKKLSTPEHYTFQLQNMKFANKKSISCFNPVYMGIIWVERFDYFSCATISTLKHLQRASCKPQNTNLIKICYAV